MKLLKVRKPNMVASTGGDSSHGHGRPFGWVVMAIAVIVLGCGLSWSAAAHVARSDERLTRQSFETRALKVAGSLDAALEHEDDFVASTGAVISANHDITTRELRDWIDSARAPQRYPELLELDAMIFVAQADLDGFIARLRADPAAPLGLSGKQAVQPVGLRPFYCLLQAVVTFGAVPTNARFGIDYCADDLGLSILAARDSGTASITAMPSQIGTVLAVQTPFYIGGLVPDTVEGRRAAYLGSIGTTVSPAALFAVALQNEPDIAITLAYDGGAAAVVVNYRDTPAHAETVREDLGNGWNATISQAPPTRGLMASGAVLLFVIGDVASLSLGLLTFALGTGRKRALRLVSSRTDELRHQALHDALTGLPNRTLILDRVEQLIARCRRNGTVGAALYVDIDRFKNINDTLGHLAGDQVLKAVATRLVTNLRGVDTIGRMSGDEFVVLVEGGSLRVGPEHVAERLLEVLREPFELDLATQHIVVTASIGIALDDRGAACDLLRDADIALYRAKGAGRNCYRLFRADRDTAVQHHYELDYDLRSALSNNQFHLFYQPIYDLSDLSIVGAEALIRWQHPTRGLLQPDDFIPLLEASGSIIEVGRWALLQACRQVKTWLDQGHDLTVSVNVSARQLDRDSIVGHVLEALSASGLDPARLILEITETALMMDTDLASRRLRALKEVGVQLAIDDFGTGYSSLAYLQRFPVDCLKIDRAFTTAVTRSAESDALIHTLVQLGKDLGLRIVAEGVETTDQLDHLRGEAVDQAQGFLLAQPLSAATFESQLLLQTPSPVQYS